MVEGEGSSWLSGRGGSTPDIVGHPVRASSHDVVRGFAAVDGRLLRRPGTVRWSTWKVLRGLAVTLDRPQTLSGNRSMVEVEGSPWLSGHGGSTPDAVGLPSDGRRGRFSVA